MPYFAFGSGVGQQQLPRLGVAAPGAALETGAAPPPIMPLVLPITGFVITETDVLAG